MLKLLQKGEQSTEFVRKRNQYWQKISHKMMCLAYVTDISKSIFSHLNSVYVRILRSEITKSWNFHIQYTGFFVTWNNSATKLASLGHNFKQAIKEN